MRVSPALPSDLPTVRVAYAEGERLQRMWGGAEWLLFPDEAILAEIRQRRLMRVDVENGPVGVFTVAYEDPVIWGERERGRHLYLHRIARAPGRAAGGLTAAVVAWARATAQKRGLDGVRLDTWADNDRLAGAYERAGFVRVGRQVIPPDAPLPAHYHGIEVVLLEASLVDDSALPRSSSSDGEDE